MVCCGRKLTSKFCAECGSINPDFEPIVSLLDYVRRQAQKMRARTDTAVRDDWGEASIKKFKISAQKWTNWEKALAALMDQDASREGGKAIAV